MYFIGCDPDTTTPSIAVVDETAVVAVFVIKQSGRSDRLATLALAQAIRTHMTQVPMPEAETVGAWAVEGQELYAEGPHKTKNPRSILFLAPVSGLLIQALTNFYPDAYGYFPAPAAWKGSVPKEIHQARICTKVGWGVRRVRVKSPYCVPDPIPSNVIGANDLNSGDWKHVLDAIGLAVWARDRHMLNAVKRNMKYATQLHPGVSLVPAYPDRPPVEVRTRIKSRRAGRGRR